MTGTERQNESRVESAVRAPRHTGNGQYEGEAGWRATIGTRPEKTSGAKSTM
jgi:hypothetical protein